ncbi:MAG TPA: hypothetical protein VFB80_23585 [Pirellulaceae bacterium]|nr:hypothetical protein [Pirellulaceae bacterium]
MSEERDELDLLAFRYVAGELTPAEAAAFEPRLADDQAAQVAVSRAVGLSQRLASAAPPADQAAPARKSALVWAQPLGWMAIGAASAVLAVNLFWRPAADRNASPATNVQPAGGSPVDALVWARLQSEQEWTAADLEDWLDQPESPDDSEEPPPAPEVPSWVFATKRPSKGGVNP